MTVRAVRHGALAGAVVLVVLVVLAVVNLRLVATATDLLAPLTGRAEVTVVSHGDGTATVALPAAGDTPLVLPVEGDPGSTAVLALDPADPRTAVLALDPRVVAADRATTHLSVLALVALVVVGLSAQRLLTRARLRRRPGREATVVRVRQQHRLLSRSWLELTGSTPTPRFPVYFDPALVTLPSPATVVVHGTGALRAVRVGDTWLYPSGRVRTAEPRGALVDNATRPDDAAHVRAAGTARLRRQLRVDLALVVPAPAVGLFWVLLVGGGVGVFPGATLLTAALALWAAAVAGSDPS